MEEVLVTLRRAEVGQDPVLKGVTLLTSERTKAFTGSHSCDPVSQTQAF